MLQVTQEYRMALEQIEWGRLQGIHGTADQFPDWLLQLGSEDEAWRREGLQLLWVNATPPCEVTPCLIPFLVDLLSQPTVQGKDDLLQLMASCCDSRQGQSAYVDAAREATIPYLSFFLPNLESPDPFVREGAIHLLSHLPSEYPTCGALLRACIETEADPAHQARMLEAYGELIGELALFDPPEALHNGDWFALFAHPAIAPSVRYTASLLAARWLGSGMPDSVVETLYNVILTPDQYSRHPNELLYRTMIDRACDALYSLENGRLSELLTSLLETVSDPEDAHLIAVRLLDLNFFDDDFDAQVSHARREPHPLSYTTLSKDYVVDRPDNQHIRFRIWQSTEDKQAQKRGRGRMYAIHAPRDPATLTPYQRHALQTVLACESVWALHSNLLERYGLPARRGELPPL